MDESKGVWHAGTWKTRAEGCEGDCLLPPAHPSLLKMTAGVGHVQVGGAGAVSRALQRSRGEASMARTGWWNEKWTSWRNTQDMTGLWHGLWHDKQSHLHTGGTQMTVLKYLKTVPTVQMKCYFHYSILSTKCLKVNSRHVKMKHKLSLQV